MKTLHAYLIRQIVAALLLTVAVFTFIMCGFNGLSATCLLPCGVLMSFVGPGHNGPPLPANLLEHTPLIMLAFGIAGDLLSALPESERPSSEELLGSLVALARERGGPVVLHPLPPKASIINVTLKRNNLKEIFMFNRGPDRLP